MGSSQTVDYKTDNYLEQNKKKFQIIKNLSKPQYKKMMNINIKKIILNQIIIF